MNEQEFVVQQFRKGFSGQQKKSFVLYGLGKNTEAILQNVKDFRFVGLLDARNVGKEFWGLKVLSEAEVLAERPQIVIIARESVVPIIYERIMHLKDEHGLQIYNFRGELLEGYKEQEYSNQDMPYWEVAEKDLKAAIDSHDNISFDVFDTLIMRKVLEPTDVFEIVERLLKVEGSLENGFRKRRLQAEKSLSGYPSLIQIYEKMGKLYGMTDEVLEEWRRMEIWVEGQVIVPRRKMVEMFQYALTQGKRVSLISDMYFSAQELEKFLNKCGIEGYQHIFVSCDHKRGKDDGSLYDVYKRQVDGGSFLHIGDNRRNDIEQAQRKGMDAFLIYSAYEMWMASSMQKTLTDVNMLEKRCILANLVWKCCEDPFALHKGKGVLIVDSPEKLGYVFLGPLYGEFIDWLVKTAKEYDIERLLLPARDGFLIEQMLKQEEALPFESVYFKASRRAVSVAALDSAKDICLLACRGFQGTFGELLERRFGVSADEKDVWKDKIVKEISEKEIVEHVLHYKEKILRHAEKERQEYQHYLAKMSIVDHKTEMVEADGNWTVGSTKRQAIFDFVASGTVQYFLQKLLNESLLGLYFATMNHLNKKYCLEGKVLSAYGNVCSYSSESHVAKHYLFLESIMIDGFPALRCLKKGQFVYEEENQDSFSFIHCVQDGILAYQRNMKDIKKWISGWKDQRIFADGLFGMLFDGSSQVEKQIRTFFANDDIFDGVESYKVWESDRSRQ